ncbi:hypothetical protein ACH95_01815 [Bacillus glycinifermentans]|uniref:DUF3889 domain-containing protein n=1 Tax=Bacillus glycinifermentans TaxID=1664069 RepID=UPI000653B20C|nr:DUF3889 domain-containing protein [Bacillus glycinifermentans]KMM63323.1 hypothetical protein ACH95_01815 [Bacillus glycinifermentans]MEC0496019.1 DUF3889 domain-containing protein [Bacillus glycinifermentans]MEC0539138.1 DUF3889 domain-containing protein [Bacillus glycinifermentans]UOY89794.1 YqzG/YhdC family protein [Bacillus glycinifermentans]
MLKKIIVSCFFLLLIIAGPLNIQAAEQTTAGMTKWEEKAVQAAKKRYPAAEVRLTQKVWDRKRTDEAVKQYHVTLSEGNRNFGVFVTISYEPSTHKINKVVVVEEYK